MVKVRVQTGQLHHHHEDEDMFERSRVTRRLSRLEAELETTTQQLGDLQRSREVKSTNKLIHSCFIFCGSAS